MTDTISENINDKMYMNAMLNLNIDYLVIFIINKLYFINLDEISHRLNDTASYHHEFAIHNEKYRIKIVKAYMPLSKCKHIIYCFELSFGENILFEYGYTIWENRTKSNEELTELNNGIRKHIIPKMKGKIIEYLNVNGYSL